MTGTLIVLGASIALLWALGAFALTANREIDRQLDTSRFVYPLGAGVHAYRDGFAGLDPAGNAKAFVPGDLFAGLFEAEVNNSAGAAAAKSAAVICEGVFALPLTGVTKADVGKPCYAIDDTSVALTGHPDAYVGRIVDLADAANYALVRLRAFGERAPSGEGCILLELSGHETFAATGATAGTSPVGAFDLKSILGTGWVPNDAEDGGIKGDFDATAEVALLSARTPNDCLPIDKGLTFEVDLVVADKGDAAALDIDFGFGTALTANSEANIDHADMVQLAAFHMDGNSDNILAQSDDNTTDVAAVDTTIDNDSATDVPKRFKIVVRPSGAVEFWINNARVLTATAFAMLSTALVSAFINAEKTSDDTTASILFRNWRVGAGMSRAA